MVCRRYAELALKSTAEDAVFANAGHAEPTLLAGLSKAHVAGLLNTNVNA